MKKLPALAILFTTLTIACDEKRKKEEVHIPPSAIKSLNLESVDESDPQLVFRRTLQYLDYTEVFSWSFAHIPDGEWEVWVKSEDEWEHFGGGEFEQSDPMVLFLDYAMKDDVMTLIPITNDYPGYRVSMKSTITSSPHLKATYIPPTSGNYELLKTDNKKGSIVLKLRVHNEDSDGGIARVHSKKLIAPVTLSQQYEKLTPITRAVINLSGEFVAHGGPANIITIKLHDGAPMKLEVHNTGSHAFLPSGEYVGIFKNDTFNVSFGGSEYILESKAKSGFMCSRKDSGAKKGGFTYYERFKPSSHK